MPIGASVAALERLEDRVLLCATHTPPTVSDLGHVQDTDYLGYGYRGFLTGTVADDTPSSTYTIEVDTNGDGAADAVAGFDPEAMSFALELLDSPHTPTRQVAVRVVEGTLDSGWQSLSYTSQPPANAALEIDFATFEVTSSGYGMSGYLRGEVKDLTRATSSYSLQWDLDGDGVFTDAGSDPTNGSWGSTAVPLDRGVSLPPGRTGFMIRVTENDAFGRTFIDTAWVSADTPGGERNQAPVFPPSPSFTIAYGNLGKDANGNNRVVGSVAAADANNDTLTYRVDTARAPGHATSGVSIDGNGQVTISNPAVVEYFFEQAGKYTFTVIADDGHTSSSVVVTIYDDWEWWIDQQRDYLDEWAGGYQNIMIEGTARAARSAAESFHNFLNDDWSVFNSIASAAHSVAWATAPETSGMSAVIGEAIGSLVLDRIASGLAADDPDFGGKLTDEMNRTIRENITQFIEDFVLPKREAINSLKSELTQNNAGLSPDALAKLARNEYVNMIQELGSVDDFEVPSSDEIYGRMLYDYMIANDIDLSVDGIIYIQNTCSWFIVWKSHDDPAMAKELNRLKFASYEGDENDPPDPTDPPIPD